MKRPLLIAGAIVLIAIIIFASVRAGGSKAEKVYAEAVKARKIEAVVSASASESHSLYTVDAELMADKKCDAWEDFLRAECTAGPVVLVLEDLHWGDLPTVKLVDHALQALAERPLLVLGIGRPELHDLFPRLWAERALLWLPPRLVLYLFMKTQFRRRPAASLPAGAGLTPPEEVIAHG